MPSFPRGHLLIYLPPSPVFRNSLSPRTFGDGRLLLYRYLGCGRERLYVPELRQKSVLVVVAAARHSPALFVEVGYFTERYGYAAMRWLERIERPIIGAFNGESGNDHVPASMYSEFVMRPSEKAFAHDSVHCLNLSRLFSVRARAWSV